MDQAILYDSNATFYLNHDTAAQLNPGGENVNMTLPGGFRYDFYREGGTRYLRLGTPGRSAFAAGGSPAGSPTSIA